MLCVLYHINYDSKLDSFPSHGTKIYQINHTTLKIQFITHQGLKELLSITNSARYAMKGRMAASTNMYDADVSIM